MRREPVAHIWDAAEAARLIVSFADGRTKTEFTGDLLLRSAIERQFEVLGEAFTRLRRDDPDAARRVPELDRVIGMRNVIAHEYGAIDYDILWAATINSMAPLRAPLEAMLEESGPAPTVRDS